MILVEKVFTKFVIQQASRIALLHSLANIEQWAIDLSWDIICRFANLNFPAGSSLPKQFLSDFIKVACDEAKVSCPYKRILVRLFLILNRFKHFNLLDKRLLELDSYFGSLPVHNGLWESATVTKDNFLSRLAIVHMVHEARLVNFEGSGYRVSVPVFGCVPI